MTNYQDLFADLDDELDLAPDELTAGDNHNADDIFFDDLSGHLDLSNEHPTEAETNEDEDALLNELTENLNLTLEERAVDGNRDTSNGVLLDLALGSRADWENLNVGADSLRNDLTEHLGTPTKHGAGENHNPDDDLLSGLTEHLNLTLGDHNQEEKHNTGGTVLSGLTEFLDQIPAGRPTGAAYFPNYANEIRDHNPPQVSLTELLRSGGGAARLNHSSNENACFRSLCSNGMVSTSSTALVDDLADGTLSRLESFGRGGGPTGRNMVTETDVSAKKKAKLIEILDKALLLVSKE